MRRVAVMVLMFLAITAIAACSSTTGNTSLPTISRTAPGKFGGPPPGAPAVGDILFAGQGQWSGSPTGFAFQWDDCNSSGASCSAAAGSPTNVQRYQIVSGDVGSTIRVAVTASYSGHPSSTVMSQPTGVVAGAAEFPLQVSGNGRFLETASGAPFLMVGDSPQSLMGYLSRSTADSYFSNRAAHGFNTVWWNLVCSDYTFCPASGIPASGIASGVAPFTSGSTPSTYSFGSGQCGNCSTTYFGDAHTLAADAEADGLEVILDPMSTDGCTAGDFMTTLQNNVGTAQRLLQQPTTSTASF